MIRTLRLKAATLAGAGVLAWLAAGCGGHGGAFTPQAPDVPAQSMRSAAEPAFGALPDAVSHGTFVAVNNPDFVPWSLFGFSATANGDVAPATRLSGNATGLDYPQGVALDGKGYAYVTQSNSNGSSTDPFEIAVYAPPLTGDKAPEAVIAGDHPFLGGTGIAVTKQGTIYVANRSATGTGYISEFAPGSKGNVLPSAYIKGSKTLLQQPIAVAIDKTGKIYVANSNGTNVHGGPTSATVTVYAAGATGDVAPLEHFDSVTGTGIAVDDSENVYVASSSGNGVYVYAAGTHALRAILGDPLIDSVNALIPTGVAVDAAGYVYVANVNLNYSDVLVYAPLATSKSAPIATIKGGATGLTGVRSVAVAPLGSGPTPGPTAKPTATPTPAPTPKPTATPTPAPAADQALYVPDLLSKTLFAFAVGATASDKPLVEISGANTYLKVPASAFADTHGNMWVTEQDDTQGRSAVLEFKAGSNGDVAPIKRLYGPLGPGTVNDPIDAILDSAGNIYVLESTTYNSNILLFAPSANGEAVATVDLSGQNPASSIALDPAQKNLYVATTGANALPEILVIPLPLKNGETTYHTITTGYAPAGTYLFGGISFDSAGNLYVAADPQGPYASAVFEFPAGKTGNVTPSRILDGASILSPTGVGVDASGLVYVANYPNLSTNTYGNITVYKPGSSTPIRTITNTELALPGVSRVDPYVK